MKITSLSLGGLLSRVCVKDVEVDYHILLEAAKQKKVMLEYILTTKMTAAILTKSQGPQIYS